MYRAGGILPDSLCTPGAIETKVTQANIQSTICVPGYTREFRPSVTYTNTLKRQQMRAYGASGAPQDYEEDHLIPLELGGHPSSPLNLWPESRLGSPNAADKDHAENRLHAFVCAGTMRLDVAQAIMALDWRSAP